MAETRVFELRTYRANPGRLDDLQARFRDHTIGLFARHGLEVVAFFAAADGERAQDTLTYLLAFPDRAAADASWTAFREDPEWIAVKAASETAGDLVAGIESTYLLPTDYSPDQVTTLGLGVQLAAQDADWGQLHAAARRADALGYDHIWLPDHLVPIHGRESSPIFEAYTSLAAIAATTTRARLGLLVGANTFRNPAVLAKTVLTLDHISGGRAILGIGAGWYAREHEAYGIDFAAGAGERLDALDEALSVIRPLLAGAEVTHDGPRYRTDHLRLVPGPVRGRLPILVGGVGERKTLRTVARYADLWNAQVSLADAPRKLAVLTRHCEEVGRDPAEIERTLDCAPMIRDSAPAARAALEATYTALGFPAPDADSTFFWAGTPSQIADRMLAFVDLGFSTITCEFQPPYDDETLARLIGEVRPLVEAR